MGSNSLFGDFVSFIWFRFVYYGGVRWWVLGIGYWDHFSASAILCLVERACLGLEMPGVEIAWGWNWSWGRSKYDSSR